MNENAGGRPGGEQFRITACGGQGAVMVASGEIDLANADRFHAAMRQVAETAPRLTVDMTEVEYCDSAAIRALFRIAPLCALTVRVSATGPLTRLLAISSLDQVATIEHPE